MKRSVVELNGSMVDYEACVALMDDDIREELHMKMAPCTDQEFLDAYVERHFEKYGVDFAV